MVILRLFNILTEHNEHNGHNEYELCLWLLVY